MRVPTPVLIAAGNPGPMTGAGNNTWLIDGDEPALIDAGVGTAMHVEAVALALSGRDLARVLVTHGHIDHASGAPALRRRWPLVEIWKLPPSEGDDWQSLAADQTLQAGNRRLRVIHTPGHALDHACFWDADAREIYSGDMLTLGTTVMIPASRGGGMRAYMDSLERLARLSPRRVFPGHGPVIDNPGELIAEYLAHRRMREAQVRECLAAGVEDAASIVARVYPNLAPALVAAATATIEAHIEKIRAEG